jgi:hypothetical protein
MLLDGQNVEEDNDIAEGLLLEGRRVMGRKRLLRG